jgi:hypothetical protein
VSWALRKRLIIRNVFLALGGLMILAGLLVGPTPFLGRLELAAISLCLWPITFYGVRGVLQLQVWQHGLKAWIRQFAAAAFFLFGTGAIVSIPLAFTARQFSPFPMGFVMFASAAYSNLATIARAERTQHASLNVRGAR